ncbi:Ldh family oxidoreductase [Corynebacterium sp. AOP40-9SA-29]|uniref:Ldh family oxidoreductase n=1 Tax=Corynebacterium sp. AOP40-9SA-29 TaxID=3457677 RepID=UPI004034A021
MTVVDVGPGELTELCVRAVRNAGASARVAQSLAEATVAAEIRGRAEVGTVHLMDYLAALRRGALDGEAEPTVSWAGSVVSVDARAGTAQAAFDAALPDLLAATEEQGVAVLRLRNAFTCGELGHYTSRLAERNHVALAVANSPALVTPDGSTAPVLGTNPLSFAAPADPVPLLIDQGISAAAYVTVREYAQRGEALPQGWALGPDGQPTTDAEEGLAGSLRPAGGHKMANIGFMVEVLAGLAGGSWSTDAEPFDRGSGSPRVGMFLVAVDANADAVDPSFLRRLGEHFQRLENDYELGLPGRRRAPLDVITLDVGLHQELVAAGG